MSKVVNAWVFGKGDQLTWKDYGGAALELADVVPVGKIAKGAKAALTGGGRFLDEGATFAAGALGFLGNTPRGRNLIEKASKASKALGELVSSTAKEIPAQKAVQLSKKGGVSQARKDFESVAENIKLENGVWIGQTKEGITVSFREVSKGKNGVEGLPTVQFKVGDKNYKIRYE